METTNLTQDAEDYGVRGRYLDADGYAVDANGDPDLEDNRRYAVVQGWSKIDANATGSEEWAVRTFVPQDAERLPEGAEVQVPKRNGSSSSAILGRVAEVRAADAGSLVFHLVQRQERQEQEPIDAEGMYAQIDPEDLDLEIFRVRKSQAGRFYALHLDFESGEFDYEGGAIRRLSPDDRLTLEQAKSLGHMFGRCIVCWAALTDPKSVERGIGPVCAKRV